MTENLPVLIVGGGPIGLTMALELQRRQISFRIIDQGIKPVETSNALVIQTRTLEVWDDEYLLPQALSLGNQIDELNFFTQAQRIFTADFKSLPSYTPFVLGLAQHQTEKLLLGHLKKKEVKVEMKTKLIDYEETNAGIKVVLQKEGEEPKAVVVDWLLGCDGYKSTIRQKADIAFLGKDLKQHFVFADVKLATPLAHNSFHFFLSTKGPLIIIPFDHGHYRILAEISFDPHFNQLKNLNLEQARALVLERSGLPIDITEFIWSSGFWIHENIAASYRKNNIFLLGDAAHVHSPAGGQGMNTGIQDAYNLAWKLALVIKGKAKQSLLNTYQAERYPVAKAVLSNSTKLTRMMTTNSPFLIKLRNIFIERILKFSSVKSVLLNTLTELNINYKKSSLSFDAAKHCAGPQPGERMIDLLYGEKARFIDPIRGTKFRLIIFAGRSRNQEKYLNFKNNIKQHFPNVMKFVLVNTVNDFSFWDEKKIFDEQGRAHKAYGASSPLFYLIRPDKYIAFRGDMEQSDALIKFLNKILINFVCRS